MRNRWFAAIALIAAAMVLVPIIAIPILGLGFRLEVWGHLGTTVLPRYLGNSIMLALGVGALTAVTGTVVAWFIVMHDFPGRRLLEWALFMPLAIPAYVAAYAIVDFLEFAGPVQSALRTTFGWQLASEYPFPEIRSLGGAIFVLSMTLYPYVYLLARAAFKEQSETLLEVARMFGNGPWSRFLRVGLPLARPGVAAGVALVMMEAIGDFGVVEYFAVQTLTTGVVTLWLQSNDLVAAAQMATLILSIAFVLMAMEAASRRRMRFSKGVARSVPTTRTELRGGYGFLACVLCLTPFLLGFLLPVAIMLRHATANPASWLSGDLLRSTVNTMTTSTAATVVTVAVAVIMIYGARNFGSRLLRALLPLTMLGYAAPGAVLAIGLLIPMAAMDHMIADAWVAVFGHDPGLIMTGSAFAIVLAYCIRFFAIAQGTADAAIGRVPPSLLMVSRSLGRNASTTLGRVYLPMIKGSLLTALLLVFVDCVKELPATLLLRPFDFNTLATRVYERASLENIGEAAPAALLISLVGLAGVIVIARANR